MALGNRGFFSWPGGREGYRPEPAQVAKKCHLRQERFADLPAAKREYVGYIAYAVNTLGTYRCRQIGDGATYEWEKIGNVH